MKYRIGTENSFVNYCPMRFIIIITSAKIKEYKKKKKKKKKNTLKHLPAWPPSLSHFAGICTHVPCEYSVPNRCCIFSLFYRFIMFPFILSTVFLPFFHSSSLFSLSLPPPLSLSNTYTVASIGHMTVCLLKLSVKIGF